MIAFAGIVHYVLDLSSVSPPQLEEQGMLPGSHFWGYCPGILSCRPVSATQLKIGHPAPVDFVYGVPDLQIICGIFTEKSVPQY